MVIHDSQPHVYRDEYFTGRQLNDPKRILSFQQEKDFLLRYTRLDGAVCDVGCSTGEFLEYIQWSGRRFGLEINETARRSAAARGVSFERSILTEEDFFDTVIFRGTIQHLPQPFVYIENAFRALKSGGVAAFLATPNANSIVYKLFNDLPALDSKLNFYIPSDRSLSAVLENAGFQIAAIEFPYLASPYARPLLDHARFLATLVSRRQPRFAFWRSMMNLIAVKP